MTLDMLLLFLAGSLQFYGAWSIDFAWHGRETTGKVGLPLPGRMVHVSDRSWWWQAWIAMIAGVALVILLILPVSSLTWIGGAILAVLGLLFVWYPWYRGRGVLGRGYAVTWNVAFFFGVVGGSVLMILGT
ncbi:MAG: hypothetical protein V3U33_00510 [candidate division NC10 bacterium]